MKKTFNVICAFLATSYPLFSSAYPFTASLHLGGFASTVLEKPRATENFFLQGKFQFNLDSSREVAVRIGRISFDKNDLFSSISDPTVTFATVVGGYSFPIDTYESTVFLGGGVYSVKGDRKKDTGGITLGFGSLFPITQRIDIEFELALHYLFLNPQELLATASVGVGLDF